MRIPRGELCIACPFQGEKECNFYRLPWEKSSYNKWRITQCRVNYPYGGTVGVVRYESAEKFDEGTRCL